MRNKLNKFTENLIRLTALERVHQLSELGNNINILDKQLELTEVVDEIILRANKAPKGLVEVVFAGRKSKRDTSVEDIIRNATCKITGPNVSDLESVSSPFRTVIIVDNMWSDNLKVCQSEYGLPDSYLK